MELTLDEADLIVYSDHPDFEDVDETEKLGSKYRWYTSMYKIVRHLPTNRYYRIDWREANTEK